MIALSFWMDGAALRRLSLRWLVGALIGLTLVIANVASLSTLLRFAENVTFVPTEELRHIQKIELMDSVTGINIMADEIFNLFWAHYFTIRKRQIFQSFPYAMGATRVQAHHQGSAQPLEDHDLSGSLAP